MNGSNLWLSNQALISARARRACALRALGLLLADGTPTGDISSDLYRPQSQDEIVEFSFFVALSYEYNLQLGCLWWKISTSSLKTYFTNLVLTFVNLVSRHENCNFPRFTWWKVDERRKMHWVTHIFITDYKKPSFSKIGQHLGTPERF